MSAPRTLRNLRADAPMPDRVSAALDTSGVTNPYRHATQPKTLDELRERCGKHGPAAVEVVKWGTVAGWCMKLDRCPPKWCNAVSLINGDANARVLGRRSPLANMDAHQRRGIGRTAVEAMQAWQAAGSPSPNLLRDIRTIHQIAFNVERMKAEKAVAHNNNEEEAR